MSKLWNVGALWKSKKPGGMPTGSIDIEKLQGALANISGTKARCLILDNNRKEKENHPDFDICISEDEKSMGSSRKPPSDEPF